MAPIAIKRERIYALTLKARIVAFAILRRVTCVVTEVDGARVEVEAEHTDTALIV